MEKVKFIMEVSNHSVTHRKSSRIQFEEDLTDDEINKYFFEWLLDSIDFWWVRENGEKVRPVVDGVGVRHDDGI